MKNLFVLLTVIFLLCFSQDILFSSSRLTEAKCNIKTLETALTAFYAMNYRYPTEAEWWDAVIEYIQGNHIPLDPWGNEYCYNNPAIHQKDYEFEIYSKGRDGVSKTRGNDPDDISNWEKNVENSCDKNIFFTHYYQFPLYALSLIWSVVIFIWTPFLNLFKEMWLLICIGISVLLFNLK